MEQVMLAPRDNIRAPLDTGGDHVVLDLPSVNECIPKRSRVVGGVARIHPDWSSLTTDPDLATLPTPNWTGGAVHSVTAPSAVTFHRGSGSFQGKSAKTGETISGLGPHEMAHAEELEANPDWVSYVLQGLRYSLTTQTYLADFVGQHVTLGLAAGEVKADHSYFLEPKYAAIMGEARQLSTSYGIAFQEVAGTDMYANVGRRTNVRRAYDDRFTAVSPDREDAVRTILVREGPVAMSAIHAILANDPRTAQSQVHALLCRRVLTYDLDLPVRGDTIVTMPATPSTIIDLHAIAMSDTT